MQVIVQALAETVSGTGSAADMGDAAPGVVDEVDAGLGRGMEAPALGRKGVGVGPEKLVKEAADGLGGGKHRDFGN